MKDPCGNSNYVGQAFWILRPAPGVSGVVGAISVGGAYGACLRGFNVSSTGVVDFLNTTSHEVENLTHPTGSSIGGIIVQGGPSPIDGRDAVTIVYADRFTGGSAHSCQAPQDLKWYAVTTYDGGVNWTSSHLIYASQAYSDCADTNRIYSGGRDFGFARDPSGGYWVAVHDTTGTIRLFLSTNDGVTWSAVTTVSPGGSVFFPTVAADSSGHILLTYYRTSGVNVWVELTAGTGHLGDAWSSPVVVSSNSPEPASGSGMFGDYMAIAAVDSSFTGAAPGFMAAFTSLDPPSPFLPRIDAAWAQVSP